MSTEPLKWVAETLGMRFEEKSLLTGRVVLDGVLDGIYLQIERFRGDNFIHVDFTAFLDPPADMRIAIRVAGVASKLGHLLGRHDIEVGDAAFDAAFDVSADEPERAQAFLTPRLRDTLGRWARATDWFHLTDEAVHYSTTHGFYSALQAEQVVADARAAASLARVASDALRGVPSSRILAQHVEAWRAHADEHRLAFSASPLRVSGRLRDALFVARAVAMPGHAYGVDLRLQFEQRLPWYVRVRPARLFDFLERTGDATHVDTGDAAFDDELRITTTDATRTNELLDPNVRAALLALHHEHGAVLFDAEGLSVRRKEMTDPETFGRILDAATVVASKLHDRAGPYRTGA